MGWLRFVVCSVLFLLAMCLVVEGRAGCRNGLGCLNSESASTVRGRSKVPGVLNSKELLEVLRRQSPKVEGEELVGWEKRWVPSGPDPLHHNGSPTKPQTP